MLRFIAEAGAAFGSLPLLQFYFPKIEKILIWGNRIVQRALDPLKNVIIVSLTLLKNANMASLSHCKNVKRVEKTMKSARRWTT